LRGKKRDGYSVWLVWTDGEEAVRKWSDTDSVYGARHLAEKWEKDGTLKKIKALMVMDMIGDADLDITRNTKEQRGSSTSATPPPSAKAISLTSSPKKVRTKTITSHSLIAACLLPTSLISTTDITTSSGTARKIRWINLAPKVSKSSAIQFWKPSNCWTSDKTTAAKIYKRLEGDSNRPNMP
jgi:Peptidase family M28.